MRKPVFGVSDLAVHPQKMARGLKFRIYLVEDLYYPCSENKGADQRRGYREADLRLCFRICKKPVFSQRGSFTRCLVQSMSETRNEAVPNTLICRLSRAVDVHIRILSRRGSHDNSV